MQYSKIMATGSYLPNKILTNHDLEKIVNTSNEWIVSRCGIHERHIVDTQDTTTHMAYQATLNALDKCKIDKSQIDLIIVATSTPDMIFPSTACLVQNCLGLKNIPAFDLQAACSGFIYGLTTADAFIKSNMAKTVLVIGVDAISKIIDYSDRDTCVLFGDGAGAVILQASTQPGIILNKIYADGSGCDALLVNASFCNGKINGNPYLRMDGKAVFKMAIRNLSEVANQILAESQYTIDQIDWFIPHQANIRIIEATAKQLSIPMHKVITTVDKHANTSAASVPLALNDAITSGKIKLGDLLLLEGVGAGFTWGASLVRY